MGKIVENEMGKIEITKEVIATLAGISAIECYGLVGMASRKMKDGISELLGRENLSKGVEVTVEEDGDLIIDLYIIVGYGTKISEVASNVISKVKYTLEEKLGITVKKVNVNVQGVRIGN